MAEIHLTPDDFGWLVAACDYMTLYNRMRSEPNFKVHNVQDKMGRIKEKLLQVGISHDGYTIAVRVPRGSCGMRNHAADCNCGGMGGDR